MSKDIEQARIIFKDDDGRIQSEIVISKNNEEKLYTLHDIVSDKLFKVPYTIISSLILYIKYLKEFTNINIEIKEIKKF